MPRKHDVAIRGGALVFFMALGGCSLAPDYVKPNAGALPEAFKGAANPEGWTQADPKDAVARGPWWKVYGDPTLDGLESKLDANNPDIGVALARLDASRAYLQELGAQQSPHASIDASPTNARQSDNRPLRGSNQPNEYDTRTVAFSASYELDLWGRIRNEVAEGKARSVAAEADLASARLSLQGRLADLYIALRGDDVELRIVQDSLAAFGKGQSITQKRMDGGVSSGLDLARANAQYADAQAQETELRVQRALTEHAIAALVGESPSTFFLPAQTTALTLPRIPLGVPSTLLERRPDIAAAERRAFAANAGIGVARAAFYPTISLGAALGWQDVGHGNLLAASNQFWSLGPLVSLNLLDGGARRGREAEAKAEFVAASAQYRGLVLHAFQQVEDNLSLLQELGREGQQETAAADAAKQSETLATNRYNEGVVSYLEVVTAQTAALKAERTAELVRTRQVQASVDLIRALGGGWHTAAQDQPQVSSR
ncbi:MAG: efflux transporter outer membrane subunit [Luteibacter sp.]|uniref:efflux transporter outer membrane subunit n=1 Tax=Luteibacter sp. TaxID=1886636 RepID=UPI002809BA8F|nr:efflux transporter outer membrane subunit [Luteibacter sp.]MDQ7994626.1 efflux transporter outer membrane subunit [Luteibacter sp.]MDQ8048199.1 efflux transporter outer membrane subunit [Luteibacter sp.]